MKNSDEGEEKAAARESSTQQQPARRNSSSNSNQQDNSSATDRRHPPGLAGPTPGAPPYPRQPRGPQRPNLRRQVIVAASADALRPTLHHGSLELPGALPAPPIVPLVPPKRPTRLPARYATGLGIHVQPPGVGGGGGEQKPNRYSWAQMQHWQQAAAASKQQSPAAAGAGQQAFHHHFSSPFSSAASRVLVVNPMQIVNLSEHTKSSLIKFIEAIKRFSEKWFSHVLLLLFLAVYACLGAYIFISFEAPTEHWEKQLIIDTRLNIVNESWHKAKEATSQDEYLDLLRVRLEDYERLLNRACASGMTSSSLENQWTFWGGLFYSMTVFTTIGYGHLTPITFAGRVATMIYAIFGIPILLMVLADLGKLLTRIIKYAFKKFRYLFNKLLRRKSSLKTRKLISDNTHQYIGVARNAFERGFAYMQHQPAALRVNSFKQKYFLRQQPQQQDESILYDAGQQQSTNNELPQTSGRLVLETNDQMDETTDVIVTPAKQTEPVSPPLDGAEKKSLADTVIQATTSGSAHSNTPAHTHNSNNNSNNNSSNNNNNQHHHSSPHRSQSPAFRIRRKVSTSGLMGSSRRHNQIAKNSPSKSSSSNMVASPAIADKQANKKHSDASNPPPVAPTDLPVTPPATVAEPISTSDIDATTDETIDVVAEFEMEEGDDEEENQEEEEEEDEFDIPVSFALFLLVTYMMFGAVVFSIWEGWNFFDSLYFVFISMSTIGFGDLVPQHPKRMIGTFIYLLFGLALTSMCINVVQEKIHATFLRAKMQIGEKMGFDLDQIMADDYYDGSLVYDVEGGETAEDTNSLAASQTYSASGAADHSHSHNHNHHHHHQNLTADESAQLSRLTSQSLDGTQVQSAPTGHHHNHDQPPLPLAVGLKQSKSRESLKGKKRSVVGLPGHHGSSGGNAAAFSGSMKRKPSKKISRQVTPSTSISTNTATVQPAELAPTADCSCSSAQAQPAATTINVMPLRSQIEVHKMEPMIVGQQHQPGINAPIDYVKSICEPLRMKIRDELCAGGVTNRPKLIATRSLQPNSCYQTEPGRRSDSPRSDAAAAAAAAGYSLRAGSEAPAGHNMQRRLPIKSSSYQCRSDLEAALSRRSSVSHELNQLDDLIVALGSSSSDKFGPLLGIPSSARSSRSNSPLNQPLARRGTSMTSRPVSSTKTTHQVTKNASVSPAHNMPPLNLSESQAALDELEAVKFRL